MNTLENADFITPARNQKLDLLLHLLINSNKPLLLRAPAGAGKTYFLEQVSHRFEMSWVACRLNGECTFDDFDELLDVCSELITPMHQTLDGYLATLESNAERVVLIVEDIHRLSEGGVEALFLLSERYSAIQLLLSTSENLEQAEPLCQVIDLEPFTQKQTVAYAKYVADKLGKAPASLAGLDEMVLFIETGGLPGRINDTVSKFLSAAVDFGPSPSTSIKPGRKVYLIPIAAAAIVTTLVFVWLLNEEQQGEVAPDSERVSQSSNTGVVPEQQTGGVQIEKRPIVAKRVEPVPARVESTTEVSETHPIAEAEQVTTPVSQETEPEKPLEELPEAVTDIEAKPDADLEASSVTQPLQEPPKVIAQQPVVASKAEPSSRLEQDVAWIKSMPGHHFTYQIMGLGKLSSAEAYVSKFPDMENIYIYRSKRNAGAWYGILYGVYADKAAAKEALPEVEKVFTGVNPWARRFDSIQMDMY